MIPVKDLAGATVGKKVTVLSKEDEEVTGLVVELTRATETKIEEGIKEWGGEVVSYVVLSRDVVIAYIETEWGKEKLAWVSEPYA